jgi:pilus assembly protein Flp/PilA
MKENIMNFLHDEKGLTTVEYAVAGALIAAALVFTFQNLGLSVAGVIGNMAALVSI